MSSCGNSGVWVVGCYYLHATAYNCQCSGTVALAVILAERGGGAWLGVSRKPTIMFSKVKAYEGKVEDKKMGESNKRHEQSI